MINYHPNKKDNDHWQWAISIVNLSCELVNELLLSNVFYNNIAKKQEAFEFSNIAPAELADMLKNNILNIDIKLFKKIFCQANGYSDNRMPNIIFLNVLKLKTRSFESIAATIIHEYVHVFDFHYPQFKFDHGDNSPINKANTAPYWIDNMAYTLLTQKPAKIINQHALFNTKDINDLEKII